MLNYSKNKVLCAVIPAFIHLLAHIQLSGFSIDHWMVYFTNKLNLWGMSWKIFKGYFEFKLSIFVQSISDEKNAMPNLFKIALLSMVSSCGMRYIPNCEE